MQYERIADSSKANDTKKKDAEQAVEKYGSSKAESTAGYMSKLEKLAPSVEFGIGNTHSSAKSGKTLTINQELPPIGKRIASIKNSWRKCRMTPTKKKK